MRSFFTFLLVVSLLSANAQITLDHTVSGYLEQTTLTKDGSKLYYYDRSTRDLTILNLDYTVYKTISAPEKGDGYNNVYLVSDSLFNPDNKIEYVLEFYNSIDSILVLNEDGDILLKSAGNLYDGPEQIIIGDTTKLIVKSSDSSWVYSVPGKYEPIVSSSTSDSKQVLEFNDGILSISEGNSVDISSVNTDAQELSLQNDTLYLTNGGSVYIGETVASTQSISVEAKGLSNVYPNPANEFLQINYQLPVNEGSGTIVLINNQGVIENEYNVFENNGNIVIDLSAYESGQYYIKLQTANGYSSIKKAIVIK